MTWSAGPSATDPRGSDRPRRRGSVVLPLALVAAGLILLLRNLGVLPSDVWANAWRLWPLLFIALGLELLLGRRGPGSIFGVLILLVILGFAVASNAFGARPTPGGGRTVSGQTSSEPLQGAQKADVTVQLGAGTLSLGALDATASDQAGQVTYSGPENAAPKATYAVSNGVAQLSYALHGSGGGFPGFLFGQDNGTASVNVALTPSVPLTLNVQSGAADTSLDLSNLLVSSLTVQLGASRAEIDLPAAAGATTATVRGGAAGVTLTIPPGVAAQIQQRGGLSTFQVDQTRFPPVGAGQYRSPDYATAANKVDLTVETGASTVTIH